MNGKEKNNSKNPNQRRAAYLLNIIFLCLLTLASYAVTGFLVVRTRNLSQDLQKALNDTAELEEERQSLYTQAQLEQQAARAAADAASEERENLLNQIQSVLESGGSTLSLIRELYQDNLVILSGGQYQFYPILSSLRKNDYKSEEFSMDSAGRLQYLGGSENVRIVNGIEVSQDTGEIDWETVQNDGIAFAMIRIGTRHLEPLGSMALQQDTVEEADETNASSKDAGRTETSDTEQEENSDESAQTEDDIPEEVLEAVSDSDLELDTAFVNNIESAAAQGMGIGVYYELGAMTSVQAQEEAEFVIEQLEPYRSSINYPVALILRTPEKDSPLAMLSSVGRTTIAIAFLRCIEQADYPVMVYGDLSTLITQTDLEQLEPYEKWYGGFDMSIYYPYAFRMWQYNANGKVQGIEGDVHLSAEILK